MYYEESRILEEEDIGYETPLYNITIYDKPFLIAVGKERKLIQKKNTYYFPVYLMNKTRVQLQIGAFDFESSKETPEARAKPFIDESGDLDLNRLGDIVLYSFADYDYFNEITLSINAAMLKDIEAKYIQEQAVLASEEGEDPVSVNREKKPFELSEEDVSASASFKQAQSVLKDGIFVIEKSGKKIALLPEETKQDAEKIKEEYAERKNPAWVEKFMGNNNYDIVETLSNGDCLFDTIRLAFEQIGYITTVAKLRAIVAKNTSEFIFTQYKELYDGVMSEIASVNKTLGELVVQNKNLKERLTKIPIKEEAKRREIKNAAAAIKQQHLDLKEIQAENRETLKEFDFMKGIDTMDQFRDYIQTPPYWADDSAIAILEKELNIKLCIFSEREYNANDEENVLVCSIGNGDESGTFSPDFYILCTYSGKHYRLITYKTKRIFTFPEIPYDIKTMVIIKCMERNSGVFSRISDFQRLKARLGLSDEEDEDEEAASADSRSKSLSLDKSTIFTFYNKASGAAKPGKASNESIPADKVSEYADLKLKRNEDWRKKLDDEWGTIFTIDNKKWKTVEHYYQAAKFKKHHPDFYNLFSLDDSGEIAREIDIAKALGSQKGVYSKGKKKEIRPADIKIDPDFYGKRQYEEREKALYAKFSQNPDLKQILLATKNAVLRQYIPKQAPVEDDLLMKVRHQLSIEN